MLTLLVLLLACASDAAPATATAAPATAAPAAAPAAARTVDVATLAADRAAGRVPLLVDVRTAEEYAAGHVPGAVNIPLDQLDARQSELEPHRADEVYLICQSGYRSARAATRLAASGFKVVDVRGGTGAWKAAGYPLD